MSTPTDQFATAYHQAAGPSADDHRSRNDPQASDVPRRRATVLGVSYDNITQIQAIESALSFVEDDLPGHAFFVNADCLVQARRNPGYARLLEEAPLVLSDGVGLSIATRLVGGRMIDNCNGTDLGPKLLAEAANRGMSVYFYGGQPGVAESAADKIRDKIPTLRIAGTDHGYHAPPETDAVIDRINRSDADILFVALGVPRQETWIAENRHLLTPRLCLGVGALLDFLSGRVSRAPRLLRSMRLEWTWRLMLEPRRLCYRYLVDGPRFAGMVISEAVSKRASNTNAPDHLG